jgi:CDP-glucose 4,6-dehydratase
MPGFWEGRRVLVTGQTGFKGAWLSFLLAELGSEVSGLALAPATQPNLHDILDVPARGNFVYADINDRKTLDDLMRSARPEVVIHMAAQSLVRPSYQQPVETFATNVVGTVSVLDAVRACPQTRAVLVVTSDKAYENNEWPWGYRESDALGGHDPYSASKGAAEIATSAMRRSFFHKGGHPARIASARAGNVIGGGDWSVDRLVPDIVRGCLSGDGVVHLRNPGSVRPWQHVLEPLDAYLKIAERLCLDPDGTDQAWNIGPDASSSQTVKEVADAIVAALGRGRVDVAPDAAAPHEAHLLTLDCTKAKSRLGIAPRLSFDETIAMTGQWYGAWARKEDMKRVTRDQIALFRAKAP